jgi:hypothetical protein
VASNLDTLIAREEVATGGEGVGNQVGGAVIGGDMSLEMADPEIEFLS